jgi:hypothetical protein
MRNALQTGTNKGPVREDRPLIPDSRSLIPSVPVMIRLVRAFHRYAKVIRLLLRELGQLHAELIEVQPGHFLVQLLRQHRDRLAILLALAWSSSCARTWFVNDEDITKLG